MIGVKSQYHFSFSWAGKSDFLTEEELKSFLLVEDAGGPLPTFQLIFTTQDDSLLSYMNEGNPIDVIMGDGKDYEIQFQLLATDIKINRSGTDRYLVKMVGMTNHLEYLLNRDCGISPKMDSISAIKQVVSKYFKFDTNRDSSPDLQYWIQSNTTDKYFVNSAWMHSYLPDSFPLIGITIDGTFRYRDAKKLVGSEPAWVVAYNEGTIIIEGIYETTIRSGFLNSLSGYGISSLETDFSDGYSTPEIVEGSAIKNLLSMANTMNRNIDLPAKWEDQIVVNSDNINPNYWKAFKTNMSSLMTYSTTNVRTNFYKKLVPIKVLDLVMFRDDEIKKDDVAVEQYSGLYFVSKVSRKYENKNVVTTIDLCRESFNSSKGNLR